MNRYQNIILLALEHIQKAQQPDGSFISLSGANEHDFSDAIPRPTTFFGSNILLSLNVADDYLKTFLSSEARNTLNAIKNNTARFLLGQKSAGWSFNYWDWRSDEAANIPYPDDLDDTFSALAALFEYDRTMIDGGALAKITKLLVATEASEGGPYKTWLVEKDASPEWHDVDIVVNSTIGYFLSLVDINLPHLDQFIGDATRENDLSSRYYPGPFHAGYFMARYYKGRQGLNGDVLANNIAARLQNSSIRRTSLERAMAISSLINLGHAEKIPPADAAALLSDAEQGGFAPYAFCIDPARAGQRSYAGASAISAALTIEAISLSLRPYSERPSPYEMTVKITTAFHERIRTIARAACAETGTDLYPAVIAQIEKTSDKKITSITYEFQSAIREKKKNAPCSIIEQLSLANFYGWMAYTIYDDAIDGEGDPLLIPCANFFLRQLANIYGLLDKNISGARDLFDHTMDCMDNANMWELSHCRLDANATMPLTLTLPTFGTYENLADRSIGHGLGSLTLSLAIGYGVSSREYQYILRLFRHYLIARQLHDDAHDWVDDLLHGHMNSVGALVLQRFQSDNVDGLRKHLNIPAALPSLRKIFWEHTITDVATLIESHIATARKAKGKSNLIGNTGFLEDELHRLESNANRANKERNDAIVFLEYYGASETAGKNTKNPLV